ncbi:DUF309 domain-containing protein [Halorubrum sp. BV1]|uniref:DUF309 domain-containing protein n=1 Tax=Halorubrum sp. BV1 TaxID=1498500 RepID=UPI0006791739|nr:DUF309 domain-containing protein [Halorubrum sp. BV1]
MTDRHSDVDRRTEADRHSGVDPCTDVDRDAALAAGAALFNEGHTLAAHDPWEAAWLPLDSGSDERLFHGLIAAAAATHHATARNWSGAVGCAANAVRYLGALDGRPDGNADVDAPDTLDTARAADATAEIDTGPVHDWCRRLAADPEVIERASPPAIRVDGAVPAFDDLDLPATLLAAPALAGSVDAASEATVEAAARLAREERGTGRTTIAELLFAFCRAPSSRPQVAARLADHVERERRKRRDVEGLF